MMMLKQCPVCRAVQITEKCVVAGRRIATCGVCGHEFVSDTMDADSLLKRYQGMEYWEKDRVHQGIKTLEPTQQWNSYIGTRMAALTRTGTIPQVVPPQYSCLEVGCSEGILLHHLKNMGFATVGCEVNQAVVEQAKQTLEVDIRLSAVEDLQFPDHSFDAIFSFHVFEHLVDPRGATVTCQRLLKPGGKMLLELPVGELEYHNLDHLHFFTHSSASMLLSDLFTEVKEEDNSYRTSNGTLMGSIYISGRSMR